MFRIVLLCSALPFLLCLVSEVQADQPEFIEGTLRAADTPEFIAEPCDGTKLTTCQSCDTIRLCFGGMFNNLNLTRKCPSSSPYCSDDNPETRAACQSTPNSQCSASATNGFVCTGAGFFPDPDSCQKYHYCEQEGQIGDTYDCPVGYRYNSRRQQCQWFNIRRCETIKCDPVSQKVFVPYPTDSSYYVYCQYDYSTAVPTYQKAYMLSCGKGSTFDAAKEVCAFQCRRVGFFVNTANPNQYFSCYRQGNRWVASVNTCAKPDYIFDESLMRCRANPNAVTTTMSPITAAPGTTTAGPGTTTAGPGTTTVGPGTTTLGPGTTTLGPATTTLRPATTTPGPGTTTAGPGTTTMGPGTTTLGPATTTLRPATTTLGPGTTTLGPITTTVGPGTTTAGPGTTTIGPGTTTLGPVTTTAGPGTTTTSPGTTTLGPVTTTLGPATTTLGPATTTLGPATTTLGPATTTLGPATTTLGPATTTLGPATTTLGPATPAPPLRNVSPLTRFADSAAVVKNKCLGYLRDLLVKNNVLK